MTFENPKISIIVPVYKVEKYLHRCLDSILAQTFTDWECILIDDGSPDNSGKICDEYGEKDNRFRVIHQENKGVSAARNIGIDVSKGEWIGFVDSDDWVEFDTYETAIEYAESTDADVVQWGLTYSDEKKELYSFLPPKGWLSYQDEIPTIVFHSSYTKLLKKKFMCQNNIRFPEGITLAEDLYFSFSVYFHSKRIFGIDKSLYYYFQNPTSAMHTFSEKKVQDEFWVVSQIEKILSSSGKLEGWENFLVKKKIQAKNNYIFNLPNPNYKLWRDVFPEVTTQARGNSSISHKLFFILVEKKLDLFANFLLSLHRKLK